MSISLAIADGHPLVLLGLQQVFARERDIDVLAQCENVEKALDIVRFQKPDVLVIDFHTMSGDSWALLRALQSENSGTRIVILTHSMDDNDPLEEFRLGVRGIVLKKMTTMQLVRCVRKVAAGGIWLESDSVRLLLESVIQTKSVLPSTKAEGLTARECDIVKRVAKGLPNKLIARDLNIGEGTVKFHLHHIYEKLGLRGRMELMLFMQRQSRKESRVPTIRRLRNGVG